MIENYPGSKAGAGVYQSIINQIPPHKFYIEPFAGSAQIYRIKRTAPRNILIDANSYVAGELKRIKIKGITEVVHTDAISWLDLNRHHFSKNVFIYCDPPYPISCRRSGAEIYENEMTDQQHQDLLQILLTIPANVAISTYKNPIYTEMLKQWRCIKFKAMTRRGAATELLYMNYDAPTALHEYTYLGSNFTDRQRIQRKINRHVNKLNALPPLEKNAILDAVTTMLQPGTIDKNDITGSNS